MLELRGLALDITAMLQTLKEPEPLRPDLWNHSPSTAAYLIAAVLDKCGDAGIALARVRIDPYVAVPMHKPGNDNGECHALDSSQTELANSVLDHPRTLQRSIRYPALARNAAD